jgi:GNAT superfamily N-acetyltransferase
MNDYFRLIRHSDRAWHDRFFSFAASIFRGGRTFFAWSARGGWVDGYDVFAVIVEDQVVSTVGRRSMRYVINGKERKGYQIGAVATHADHRNRGLARLLMNKVSGELDAPDQPVILFWEFERARLLSTVRLSQARPKWFHRACRRAARGRACPKSGPRKANRPRVVG